MIPNAATKDATAEAVRKLESRYDTASVLLGRTGFRVSSMGFGGYRVSAHHLVHREALKKALLSGCNLIDTSANYADGESEILVGQVLSELVRAGSLSREGVVVVTKVGYVQGSNFILAQERERGGVPFHEMVKFSDDCWHCLSPQFLADQIGRCLDRLQLQTIDVLLLHNPEYYLKAEGDHAIYYDRIRRAFEYLETEVARGRIQYYGISSNTFGDPKEAPDYTSLETVLQIAESLSPQHHFAVIEFPFNLYEPGAVLEENNLNHTVASFAAAHNLGTLINRPLNAFSENKLIRLADFPAHDGRNVGADLRDALERCMALESEYKGKEFAAVQKVAWGHVLKHNMPKLADLDRWKYVLASQIRPPLYEGLAALSAHEQTRDWAREYGPRAESLFSAFSAYLESQMAAGSRNIADALDEAVPALRASSSLSQKVVRIYRSLPGLHCILVGMRQAAYVDDILNLQPRLSHQEAYMALEAAHRRKRPADGGHGHT